MTKVKVKIFKNLTIGLAFEGHAGFNPGGPDIVCAALSTASQMTINGILDWTGLSVEDIVKKCDEKLGVLEIEIPDGLNNHVVVQQLFKSFEMYVESLAEQYKDYVSLERSIT